MKKNYLALDLGVGSLGVALLKADSREDVKPENLHTFVRIFDTANTNIDRRAKRLIRRTLDKKQKRKIALWKELSALGFSKEFKEELLHPEDSKKIKLDDDNKDGFSNRTRFGKNTLKKDVYTLRYKGLDEKLSPYEIGYVLYFLANHRGSSAISALDVEDGAKGENKQKLATTAKLMKEKSYRTIGEMLYKESIDGKTERSVVRNKKNKSFKYFADRFSILHEVDLILKNQQKYYPELLTDNQIEKLKDIIDFEGEKDVVESKKCIYTGLDTVLLASELYEERRILELLNNVRMSYKYDEFWRKKPLNEQQRDILFNELIKGNSLSSRDTIKLLKDTFETKDIAITMPGRKNNKELKGSSIVNLQKLDFYKNLEENARKEFVREYVKAPDDKSFIKFLKEKHSLTQDEAKEILMSPYMSLDNIRKGYSDISEPLTLKIIEKLRQNTSVTYNEALEQVLEEDAQKPAGERLIKEREYKTYSKLPYYGEVLEEYVQGVIARSYLPKFKDSSPIKQKFNKDELKYGQIPNPVVHKSLNQIRKVINEVIEKHGPLEEIIIEYSRELAMSEDEREKLSRNQNANEKEIEEVKKLFATKGYVNPSPTKIKAYRLAKMQGFVCPYTAKEISVYSIVNGEVDVDHIIPESFSHDSRNGNLVACYTEVNAVKTNKTPHEAFYGTQYWNNVLSFLNAKGREKYNEYNGWRFKEGAREEFKKRNPFLQRFKTDNSYIAKASKKYLQSLFEGSEKRKVYTFKSDLVGLARKYWGFNNLTFELTQDFLNTDEKKAFEEAKNATTNFKKNRLDHRHHAMDALMLLLVNRSQQQRISTLTAKYGKDYFKDFNLEKYNSMTKEQQDEAFKTREEILREPLLSRGQMKDILLNTKISIKANHKLNKGITKDTLYKLVVDSKSDDNYIRVTSKKAIDLKDLKLKPDDSEDKEKVKSAIAKTMGMLGSINVEDEIREENEAQLNKMIGLKVNNYDKLDGFYDKAIEALEKINKEKQEQGLKLLNITEGSIWTKALELMFKKYPNGYKKFENQKIEKTVVLKEPRSGKAGSGYASDTNNSIDLYYDKQGKLKAEVIRTIDALNKDFKPKYAKKGFKKVEKLYSSDVIEFDFSSETAFLSNVATGAPKGKVWLRQTTFTALGEGNVDVLLRYYNKSGSIKDTNRNIASLGKLGFRRVVLTPLGEVKYRSPLLKHKE